MLYQEEFAKKIKKQIHIKNINLKSISFVNINCIKDEKKWLVE